jgi:hypothetical protein
VGIYPHMKQRQTGYIIKLVHCQPDYAVSGETEAKQASGTQTRREHILVGSTPASMLARVCLSTVLLSFSEICPANNISVKIISQNRADSV